MASRPTPREAIPLLSDGEAAELVYHRPPHPCRNATMLLVVSLLVNALCMSAIMTQEMEHSAEHLVKTNQLHAVDAATAKHALAHVDSRSASSPSAFSSTSPAAAASQWPAGCQGSSGAIQGAAEQRSGSQAQEAGCGPRDDQLALGPAKARETWAV